MEEFRERIKTWIENITSEVRAHDSGMSRIEKNDLRLQRREFLYPYDDTINFSPKDIILDIGSGAVPLYGNLINGEEFQYIPIDPLVYEYQKLYKKYNVLLPVVPNFGIMELLTYFYSHDFADYVICNNSLDHSIDIMQSLFEILSVVKIDGSILLVHHEHEAENNRYKGFHQWNISFENNHLFFYDYHHKYDISSILSNFCEIYIKLLDDSDRHGCLVFARIIKRKSIPKALGGNYVSMQFQPELLKILFSVLAGSSLGYFPCGEAFIPEQKTYVIWGIGAVGAECLSWFGEKKKLIHYFLDNKQTYSGRWNGFSVYSPTKYRKEDGFLLVASVDYADEICEELSAMGLKHGVDYLMYDEWKSALISGHENGSCNSFVVI